MGDVAYKSSNSREVDLFGGLGGRGTAATGVESPSSHSSFCEEVFSLVAAPLARGVMVHGEAVPQLQNE